MKSSVKDTIQSEYAEEAPKAATAELVPAAEPTGAVVPNSFFSNENMEGEYDRSDLQIPGLNLVQSVGPLSENFTPGQLVYNKEEVVCEPWTPATEKTHVPLKVTVLRTKKFFQEKLPYGSETLPRRFDTQEEARAAGLTPLYAKVPGCGNYEPLLECQVLIEGDPEKHTTWPLEFAGKPYAIARLMLRSVAFSTTGKAIITASQFGLRDGLHTGFWLFAPKREKVGTNFVWIPRARLGGKHSPEFVEWVKTNM